MQIHSVLLAKIVQAVFFSDRHMHKPCVGGVLHSISNGSRFYVEPTRPDFSHPTTFPPRPYKSGNQVQSEVKFPPSCRLSKVLCPCYTLFDSQPPSTLRYVCMYATSQKKNKKNTNSAPHPPSPPSFPWAMVAPSHQSEGT